MPVRTIPDAVVKRLTKYLTCLREMKKNHISWVSSRELAEALELTSSTVRQDLSYINIAGISKRGYETGPLQEELEKTLGVDRTWNAVIVGAGNLGKALALHEEFSRRGFNMKGVFDRDENKIGKRVGKMEIQGMENLPAFVGREQIDIGIVAVPAEAAQRTADLLIAARVKGLLNLSLTHLVVPKWVAVVDTRIVAGLQELVHSIKFRNTAGKG